MDSTFNLWTVENPMTVIASPWFDHCTRWNEFYIYTSWDHKTMNLNTIKITLSLN